jgi:hypothetical protein
MSAIRQQVVPEKPKVLNDEQVYVYLPVANDLNKGIASFESKDFTAPLGRVKLRWPMDMMVEDLADPTVRPSLVKVLSDEFEKTTVVTSLINPKTGIAYESDTAEIKLNRRSRNALVRPELVMLSNDFEAIPVVGPNGEAYNSYAIKRSNPLVTPSIIQVDSNDFNLDSGIVKINWPLAHDGTGSSRVTPYGMVKIKAGDGLKFDAEHYLQVDPVYLNNNVIVTKETIGLGNVENRAFASWEYTEFGTNMKAYLQGQFDSKLNKALWDGTSGLFRDWDAPSQDQDTVQKRLDLLQLEGESLRDVLETLDLFLGIYATSVALESAHPATAALSGHLAYVNATDTYWTVTFDGQDWQWEDVGATFSFLDLIETNTANLKANGSVASVGSSGKWVNSDHIHPSDPTKAAANLTIGITTVDSNADDFVIDLSKLNVNIPYIKTAQHLHNWKQNISEFVQNGASNEAYWAGTLEEFNAIIPSELPNGALIVVDDDEETIAAGKLVVASAMNELGITVPEAEEFVTEQFVVVDVDVDTYGVPVMLSRIPAVDEVGERRKLTPLPLSYAQAPQEVAVIVTTNDGPTIGRMALTHNRVVKSDDTGKLDIVNIHPSNLLSTGVGDTVSTLLTDRVLMADSGNIVKVWESGVIANKPIGSNGTNGLSVIVLNPDKIVKSNANGALENVTWLEENLIKSSTGSVGVVLDETVAIIGPNNTLESWNSAGYENQLVVRGATPGSIKVRTPGVANKLLASAENGTIQELPFGEVGQMLVSDGIDGPGWVDVPEAFEHLPQTVLTVNPTEEAAVAFKGLVAVFASVLVEDMRSNCIYYY